MQLRSASRLTDTALALELDELCASDRSHTAQVLIHIGEFDRRRLYLPAGYPSMFQYCVQKCLMSEGAAYRRIRAARTARHYPGILKRISDGTVNLTTIVLLTPYLSSENAFELLDSAAYKRRWEVELLIARRFPQPDLPTIVEPRCQELTPASVETLCMTPVAIPDGDPVALEPSEPSRDFLSENASTRVGPLAPERFGLQTTIDRETHDLLRRAQDLLGHQIPAGEVAEVLKRALASFVNELEKQKFAGSNRPRGRSRSARSNSRYLPMHVRKAVWERDGGQCTFEGDSGHRCQERKGLEFDHILPVARGGTATIDNIRLRCPGHNQLEAERVFGTQFMENKREQGREGGVLERTG